MSPKQTILKLPFFKILNLSISLYQVFGILNDGRIFEGANYNLKFQQGGACEGVLLVGHFYDVWYMHSR